MDPFKVTSGSWGLQDDLRINDEPVSETAAARRIRERIAAGKFVSADRHTLGKFLGAEELEKLDRVRVFPSTQVSMGPPQVTMVVRAHDEVIPSATLLTEIKTNVPFRLREAADLVSLRGFRLPWTKVPTTMVVLRLFADDTLLTEIVFWPGQLFAPLEISAVPGYQQFTLKCIDTMTLGVVHIVSEGIPSQVLSDRVFYIRTRSVGAKEVVQFDHEELCQVTIAATTDEATVTASLADGSDDIIATSTFMEPDTKLNTLTHSFGCGVTPEVVHDCPVATKLVATVPCVVMTKTAVRFMWPVQRYGHNTW